MQTIIIFVFSLLVLTPSSATNHNKTQFNDRGDQISLPDNWVKTVIGELFYHSSFVFTDSDNSDMLIIEIYPKGMIFNQDTLSENPKKINKQLTVLNKLNTHDDFFTKNEHIMTSTRLDTQSSKGVFFTSKVQQSNSYNYSWMGTTENSSVIVKIISKSKEIKFDKIYFLNLINDLQLIPVVKNKNRKQEDIIVSPFNYRFSKYPALQQRNSQKDKESYKYSNLSFTEADRYSVYTLSSQCSGLTVPNALLLGVVMDDFGYDNTLYSHEVNYQGKQYFFNYGQYSNTNGTFNTLSFVINKNECQHILSYIVEDDDAPLSHFLNFVDHFIAEPSNKTTIDDFNENQKQIHARTLSAIGDSYYALKNHTKSLFFYQKAFDFDSTTSYFYAALQSFYNRSQYQEGLAYLELYESKINESTIKVWKAWYLARLQKPQESSLVFKTIFDQAYTEDDDFFKYLEQLYLIEDYKQFQAALQKHRTQVSDLWRLKAMEAKMMIKTQPKKAESFIVNLFENEGLANKYQFDLFDYLSDIEAYETIVKLAQKRIEKGYESAVLLNYLGDAQNMLGQIELAFKNMEKAHTMAPGNTTIESYYKSLRKKVGKSDLSAIDESINPVAIPKEILTKTDKLQAKYPEDSYEYLYLVSAYQHIPKEKNKHTLYGKIKINNESGLAKNKTLRFGFDQEYERAYINYFRVLDENNSIIADLDKSTSYITTDNDGITADEDKLINIPVPSLSIGTMIEYAVTIQDTSTSNKQSLVDKLFVSSANNQYKAIVFTGKIEAIKAEKSDDVAYHEVSDSVVYWDYHNLPNYRKTPYLPDYQTLFPWLKFASITDSWVKLGDDYLHDIKDKINTKNSDIQNLNFIQETDTPLQKAQAIIAYVQKNITYQALEFGWRAFVPNRSEVTLNNRYGDCKDHAVLLHDMLNANGIKAQLALINSSNDIALSLPSFSQFDHMIVYLPEINEGVFVDVTDKDSTLNLSNPPSNLQNHHALVLQSQTSKLVQVPKTKASNNTLKINRQVHSNDSVYFYTEKVDLTGHLAATFRSYIKSIALDEMESTILSWVNDYYSDLTLEEFKFHNLYDNRKTLHLEFRFSQEKEDATVKLPVFFERYAMAFSKAPNRKWDFEYKYPFEINSQTTIRKGSSLKFKKNTAQNNTAIMKWQIDATKKLIQFSGTVYSNHLPANEYKNLVHQGRKSYKILENLLL